MALPQERKACAPCARSKRKCGRELPICARCHDRGIDCTYPPPKPSCWVLMTPPGPATPPAIVNTPTPAPSVGKTISPPRQLPSPPEQKEPSPPASLPSPPDRSPPAPGQEPPARCLTLSDLQSAWFLTPETWDVHHVPDSLAQPFVQNADGIVHRFVSHIQSMVSDWAVKGHSTFIHARLYRARMPRPAQDAFTALAAYLTRTPQTQRAVLSIIGDRLAELVDSGTKTDPTTLGVMAHLARVHALVTYTVVALFDGDVRLRHTAETRLGMLGVWSYQMLAAARVAALDGRLLRGNLLNDGDDSSGDLSQADAFWHAWVLAESVRRTWMIAAGVRVAYRTLQDGVVRCGGGLMFTTRNGVWDAPSAWAWAKLCAESDVGFLPQAQTKRLFSEKNPGDIDEFGKVMLEVTYGTNKMESWGVWH
ncbi:hypothetical protein QBC47DRAFT_416412 [Echria macrotheca]|uniref:Zn(2)-C6 fungal-type domain-containing protein n=1 Tax=Echria macrotheca TaxID=438768 RepID=A0AAJ0B8N5_9PEZI|nr:hypothetical protein QBC47DRAFT_416412 [Echria macrotheca]